MEARLRSGKHRFSDRLTQPVQNGNQHETPDPPCLPSSFLQGAARSRSVKRFLLFGFQGQQRRKRGSDAASGEEGTKKAGSRRGCLTTTLFVFLSEGCPFRKDIKNRYTFRFECDVWWCSKWFEMVCGKLCVKSADFHLCFRSRIMVLKWALDCNSFSLSKTPHNWNRLNVVWFKKASAVPKNQVGTLTRLIKSNFHSWALWLKAASTMSGYSIPSEKSAVPLRLLGLVPFALVFSGITFYHHASTKKFRVV